jgi:uncharacterized protein
MSDKAQIYGRKKEKESLKAIIDSKKSEFLAVYGRRRVGKTFLIKELFNYNFAFYITGYANSTTRQQLFNFDSQLSLQTNNSNISPSDNWLIAFQKLIQYLETIKHTDKKIIFIDELPWFDTQGSDFMMGLEHFWNHWASNRKDIVLIVCGSAASWMINELINNTGGLHNRITQKMKIEPFNLQETEELLLSKNAALDRYQIVQLYMTMGGIPYYLDAVQPHLSATQNIQMLFFEKNGLLQNEFYNLYRSLFRKHEIYEKIVEVLATKTMGLQRSEIIKLSGMASGGTLTKVLADLEESGFIHSYSSITNKLKEVTYRLSDYYTAFYFNFLNGKKFDNENYWINMIDHPIVRAWQGFAFEQVCLDHVFQIKKGLGVSGIQSNNTSWIGKTETKAAQIDLLIDRRDQVINLCECKFSINKYEIDSGYAEKLRTKIAIFKEVTKTRKAVFLTMITTYGIDKNKYSNLLVQNEITMDNLFE